MALPLSLYVHLPWCVRKCPYCDFNSHALKGDLDEMGYVDLLAADIATQAPHTEGRKIQSVFFGGGTPSLFSATAIERVLDAASRTIGFADGVEITLEANPGTVEHDSFPAYRRVGVNRLSLGVQSFDARMLSGIGRIHDGDDALRALDDALGAGFDCVNADLMYGLPGQSIDDAVRDVERAISAGVQHVSHYELTLEPNTLFYRFPPERADADTRYDMESACAGRLHDAGLRRYEVSAWAVPGQACRHNLNYWRFGDYIGAGAGAHGKLTNGGRVVRTRHEKHPRLYKEKAAGGPHRETVKPESLPFEFMLNALRLTNGFEDALFAERTGRDGSAIAGTLDRACAKGLLEHADGRWRATGAGLRFLNDLTALFLDPGCAGARAPGG